MMTGHETPDGAMALWEAIDHIEQLPDYASTFTLPTVDVWDQTHWEYPRGSDTGACGTAACLFGWRWLLDGRPERRTVDGNPIGFTEWGARRFGITYGCAVSLSHPDNSLDRIKELATRYVGPRPEAVAR